MQTPPGPIRAVIFDLWNTLSWSDHRPNPMLLLARALGIEDRPDWRKILERGMMTRPYLGIREALEGLVRQVGGLGPASEQREELIRQWNRACAATRLYDDALPALRALRKTHRLAILSNTQSFDMEFMETRGVTPLVDAVCLSCDLGRLKPDPLAFQATLEQLGVPAGQAVMVGDSLVDDVAGALGVGLAAVHLDRAGTATGAPDGARSIRSLIEIPSLLTGTKPSSS